LNSGFAKQKDLKKASFFWFVFLDEQKNEHNKIKTHF